jgi:intracellular septation protein
MSDPKPAPKTDPKAAGAGLLVDLGPLLIFLGVYWLADVIYATAAFMLATAAALVWSRVKFGKISPLLLFSGVMVMVFGGLTIFLHDKSFIQIKPTVYYAVVAGLLFYGVRTRKPTLKLVMEHAYPNLRETGWHLLTRNFAWFFVGMAIMNEVVRHAADFNFWLGYKLWGALPATFLFGLANVPMILRHSDEDETEAP